MSKKSDIEVIFETGIDEHNRKIYFGSLEEEGDFTWASIEKMVRTIHYLSQKSKQPIELHMSSNGGNVLEMLRLYDTIALCPCPIHFYGSGEISSSATWIMAGCDERYLTKNTRICIHDSPSIGTDEMPTKLVDKSIYVKEDEALQLTLNQMYADNSKMPIEFWNAIVKRDAWLTADEALELGLVDKILQPIKRGNFRRKRIASLNKVQDKSKLNNLVKKILKDNHSDMKTLKLNINPTMDVVEEVGAEVENSTPDFTIQSRFYNEGLEPSKV